MNYIPATTTGQSFFQSEPPDAATIWRYMDLYKYLALILGRELTFVSLSQMQDSWEGAPNRSSLNFYLNAFRHGENSGRPMPWLVNNDGSPCRNEHEVTLKYENDRNLKRDFLHVNCWHLSEGESEAMWKLYGLEGKGIAVRSTWGALRESLKVRGNGKYWVWGGKIVYADPRELDIPLGTMSLDPVAYKRPAFAHEREVRLVISAAGPLQPAHETCPDCSKQFDKCECREGFIDPVIHLGTDIEMLVQEIRIHPDTAEWQLDVIRQVTKEAGVQAAVNSSDLSAPPTLA